MASTTLCGEGCKEIFLLYRSQYSYIYTTNVIGNVKLATYHYTTFQIYYIYIYTSMQNDSWFSIIHHEYIYLYIFYYQTLPNLRPLATNPDVTDKYNYVKTSTGTCVKHFDELYVTYAKRLGIGCCNLPTRT